ncbi:MAG: helix-turn-helix domain-containing protein [Crocosphaera sp.]
MLLANLSVETNSQKSSLESHLPSIERVILSMYKHLDEPLSLSELAEIAQLSPYHFNRIFRKITGTPPLQFLYRVRINSAKQLLLTTELSITDICYETGYNSIGSFTTRFTNLVGLSPKRFRHLATSITPSRFYDWCTQLKTQSDIIPIKMSLAGKVHDPENKARMIFVGLFKEKIPKNKPIKCNILMSPGWYRMTDVEDGKYYICAVAFTGKEPLSFLLNRNVLTEVIGPISVQNGRVEESKDLILRSLHLFDPPLLIALPILMQEKFNALKNFQHFIGNKELSKNTSND